VHFRPSFNSVRWASHYSKISLLSKFPSLFEQDSCTGHNFSYPFGLSVISIGMYEQICIVSSLFREAFEATWLRHKQIQIKHRFKFLLPVILYHCLQLIGIGNPSSSAWWMPHINTCSNTRRIGRMH
jgi:hypothetical protein